MIFGDGGCGILDEKSYYGHNGRKTYSIKEII